MENWKYDSTAVGERIRRRRTELGLTQAQLAEKINRAVKYCADIERGTCGHVDRHADAALQRPSPVTVHAFAGRGHPVPARERFLPADTRRPVGMHGRTAREYSANDPPVHTARLSASRSLLIREHAVEPSVPDRLRAQMVVVLPCKAQPAHISLAGQQLPEPPADFFVPTAQPVCVHVVEMILLDVDVEFQILLRDVRVVVQLGALGLVVDHAHLLVRDRGSSGMASSMKYLLIKVRISPCSASGISSRVLNSASGKITSRYTSFQQSCHVCVLRILSPPSPYRPRTWTLP